MFRPIVREGNVPTIQIRFFYVRDASFCFHLVRKNLNRYLYLWCRSILILTIYQLFFLLPSTRASHQIGFPWLQPLTPLTPPLFSPLLWSLYPLKAVFVSSFTLNICDYLMLIYIICSSIQKIDVFLIIYIVYSSTISPLQRRYPTRKLDLQVIKAVATTLAPLEEIKEYDLFCSSCYF